MQAPTLGVNDHAVTGIGREAGMDWLGRTLAWAVGWTGVPADDDDDSGSPAPVARASRPKRKASDAADALQSPSTGKRTRTQFPSRSRHRSAAGVPGIPPTCDASEYSAGVQVE